MGAFKKYDGNIWQPINPKQLKGIPYTGTLPATLTGTKAGYLHRYKVYGNTEQTGTPTPENPVELQECGERTEQLIDSNDAVIGKWITADGAVNNEGTGGYVVTTVNGDKPYILTYFGSEDVYAIAICWYDNDSFLSRDYLRRTDGKVLTVQSPSSANQAIVEFTLKFINMTLSRFKNTKLTFTEGSTAPTAYIPYGYKLPLLSGSTPVDIYLGDDTLSAEEYVDSGTGKIYRMVGGVLTPVDPPVPFPQIPTSANSTTISWAGQGLAPSEFDSIQEWVDNPSYKRVNGEWVADNSN